MWIIVCVCGSRSMAMSFDIKFDRISEFYQAFNICAVHVSLLKWLLTTFKYVVKVMHDMKRSLHELVYIIPNVIEKIYRWYVMSIVVIVLFFIPRLVLCLDEWVAAHIGGSRRLSFTQVHLQLAALHAFPSAQQWQLISFIRSGRPGGPLSMLRQVIPSRGGRYSHASAAVT